jgi:O-antigen/teichoic acid export membrane protein
MSRLAPDRLAGAAAWRYAYLAVQGTSSLVLFVALAHVLPSAALRTAALAQGVLVVSQALGDFGLSQTSVTALTAQLAEMPRRAADLRAAAARAFLLAAGAGGALSLVTIAFLPGAARLPVALIAPAAALTVVVAGADGLLRAGANFHQPVLLVACSRGGMYLAVPVAMASGAASWTCAAMSAGAALGTLPALRYLLAQQSAGDPRGWVTFVKSALPLGLSQLFVVTATRFNTIVLGAIGSLAAAAAFEAAWRLFQLGQYAVGAFATAVAPFMADALGARRERDAQRLIRRSMLLMVVGGVAVGAVLLWLRRPIAELLFDELSAPAAAAMVPLGFMLPLTLTGLLASYALAATEAGRRAVLWSSAGGALVNVGTMVVVGVHHGARGAAISCAAGLAVSNVWMLGALARMRSPDPVPSRQGETATSDSGRSL